MNKMTKKILVVDDEPDIRTSIKTILEKEGYTVFEAANGRITLNLLKKEKFDLIILDVMMPEMSGWDVFKEILKTKKEYKGKIMFLTVVKISEERKKELIKEGAVDYITKPFDIDVLVKKVKNALK